jgi:hypothetical protein
MKRGVKRYADALSRARRSVLLRARVSGYPEKILTLPKFASRAMQFDSAGDCRMLVH